MKINFTFQLLGIGPEGVDAPYPQHGSHSVRPFFRSFVRPSICPSIHPCVLLYPPLLNNGQMDRWTDRRTNEQTDIRNEIHVGDMGHQPLRG